MAASGLSLTVSELFVSVQGEGPSTGKAAAFVRLGHCNLTCSYCDTAYTWDFARYDENEELRAIPAADIVRFLCESAPGRAIFTGGEPLIQQKVLGALLAEVDQESTARASTARDPRPWAESGGRLLVEVETNGTIRPTSALAERVDQWNVSPKLASSGEPANRRLRESTLEWFAAEARAYFKFVVGSRADADEAMALARRLGLAEERVFFMPMAKDRAELEAREPGVLALAQELGVRSTTRLHLKLWDGARGH